MQVRILMRLRLLGASAIAFALLVCATAPANAQSDGKTFRVGFVALVTPGIAEPWLRAFHEEFRKLGYEEGRNMTFLSRYAGGDRERLKDLAAEIAAAKADVFLAAGEPSLIAAKSHGANIPIVTVSCDPLDKLMGSLARPGGNATGFTCISTDLGSKRLGLLKALLPKGERLAVLYSAPDTLEPELRELESQGRQIGLEVARFPVRSAEEFAAAFRQMADGKSDALYIAASSFANLHRARLAELALEHRLPAVYGFREFAQAGGLMTYGTPLQDGFRRAAHQIDKILKGASPRDVPLEQPTRFELVVNMRTAKALGIEVPPSVLVQAEELIE
jgi:putative tryptophan/tyrosine transport system substrate-binding protein